MHLDIEQSGTAEERVSSTYGNIVQKLYDLAYEDASTGVTSSLDSTSKLIGTIRVDAAYQNQVEYLNEKFKDGFKIVADALYMSFVDPEVEKVMVANFARSGLTGLTESDLLYITDIKNVFQNNTEIVRFPEFSKTGVTTIGYNNAFSGCTNLKEIDLSKIISFSGGGVFNNCTNLGGDIILPNATRVQWGLLTAITSLTAPLATWLVIGNNNRQLKTVTAGSNQWQTTWGGFYQCTSLERIYNLLNLNTLPHMAFCYCTSLYPVVYFPYITQIDIWSLLNQDGGRSTFMGSSVREFYFPSLIEVKNAGFGKNADTAYGTNPYSSYSIFGGNRDNPYLVNVFYLKNIEKISLGMFNDITMANLVINNITPPELVTDEYTNGWPFFARSTVTNIYVPDSAVDTYKNATAWGDFADKIKPLSEMPRVATESAYDALKASGDNTIRLIEEYM